MILLNLRHVSLAFTTKHRFPKTVPQSHTKIKTKVTSIHKKQTLEKEGLTLAILYILISLCLYIHGALNQLPNYFLTESTK